MLGGIGDSVRQQIREYMESREAAEKVHKVVGADKRLSGVRYGTFAENGAIKPQYVPQGMSPNLLPAKWAEYQGYKLDSTYDTGGDVTLSKITNDIGYQYLQTYSATTSKYHYPYLDAITSGSVSQWRPVSAGLSYIYSTTALMPVAASGTDRYVGLRITAASDSSGTSPVVLYQTSPTDTASMFLLTGVGGQTRVYAKFAMPSDKTFIKVEHFVYTTGANTQVGWNWNMLELISDYRSFPSKYSAPTPQAGELSVDQMQFGLSKNLFPYGEATLSAKFDPFGSTDVSSPLFVSPTAGSQGLIVTASDGTGYRFTINADNAFHRTANSLIPTNAPTSTEKLLAGSTYIISADVTNLTSSDITFTMRAKGNVTAADNAANTNFTTYMSITVTLAANNTTPTRVYKKFTVPSGIIYGPTVEFRGTRVTGTSTGLNDEVSVQNLMLERVPSGVVQDIPSAWTAPIIGKDDINRYQIGKRYAGKLRNDTTGRTIATGVDQIQTGMTWEWSQKYDANTSSGDWQGSYFYAPVPGIYLVQVRIAIQSSITTTTRVRTYITGDIGTQVMAQANIPPSVGSYLINLTGSAILQLETATGFELHVQNFGADTRIIDATHMWISEVDRM